MGESCYPLFPSASPLVPRVNTPLVEAKRGTSTRPATTYLRRRNPPTQLINNAWLACHFFCFSTTAPGTPIWARLVPGRIWSAINGTTRSQLDATRGLCPRRPLRLRWRRRSVCWLERPTATDQSHNIVPLAAQRRRSGIIVSLHFHKSCQCGWRWDNSFGFLVAPRPQRVPSVLYIIAGFRSLSFISISRGAALHFQNLFWIWHMWNLALY